MDLRQYFAPGKPRRRLMMTFLGVLTCALYLVSSMKKKEEK